jgi:hypothetical protein
MLCYVAGRDGYGYRIGKRVAHWRDRSGEQQAPARDHAGLQHSTRLQEKSCLASN